MTALRFILILVLGSFLPALAQLPAVTETERDILRDVASLRDADPDAAARILEAARSATSSAALDLTLGQLRLLQNLPRLALPAFEQALLKQPGLRPAQDGAIQSHWQLQQWDQVEPRLKEALTQTPFDEARLLQLGYALLQQNKPVSAETLYRQALVANTDSRQARMGLARCLREQKRFAEAKALAGELLQDAALDPHLWREWVALQRAAGEPTDALAELECMRRLSLCTPTDLATLGDLFAAAGQPAPAAQRYTEALRKADVLPPKTLRHIADQAVASENPTLLRTALNALARRAPDDPALPVLRAAQHQLAGDTAAAIDAYQSVVRTDPLNADALLGLADALAANDNPTQALPWLQRAARAAAPDDQAKALQRLMTLAAETGDHPRALSAAQQLLVLRDSQNLRDYIDQLRRLVEFR